MHHRMHTLSLWLSPLLLVMAAPASHGQDSCPSLSGCSYQAGRAAAAAREPVAPAPSSATEPRPPATINSCDAGGCVDTGASRYNGNATSPESGVYLDSQGRRCVRSGGSMQCG